MIRKHQRRSILASLFAAGFGFATLASSALPEPYPLEYWALREVVNDVQVSPEGDQIALLKIATKDADPVLEIYDASDLSKEPYRIGADPMEIINYYWVSNDVIAFNARQVVRDQIEGFNQGVYEYKFALVNLENERIKTFAETELAAVENLLPDKPDHIIVAYENYDTEGPGRRISPDFRPAAYWEYNIKTGAKKLLYRGTWRVAAIEYDSKGNERVARGFDERSGYFLWYYRDADSEDWEEVYRLHEDEWEIFEIAGFDEQTPGLLFVYAHNGRNTIGLWEFDAHTKTFLEPIFHPPDVDVWGVSVHSNPWAHPDEITGVIWRKDKRHIEFWNAEEEALQRQLEEIIPNSHHLSFARSRDGATIVVANQGPHDPGTYYLVKDGKLQVVGSHQPLIESEKLADVKYITYESRDGRTIPAFITVPNSEPPYPLIVMPHGGPFVSEVVAYDEWGQMLANNGYLVLQPQYRGSQGYGLEFYQAAFLHGGQGGYAMQDDKDDGALYLVEQGLADRERMAMYGWSYGGYAALVAASRTPQVYQCVIAGAAVSDRNLQLNYYRFELRGSGQVAQLNMWDDSISPVKEVAKVNVPVLLIHGTVDQRVPPKHAKLYHRELERHEKNYKYVELEGADHFSSTLFYDHQLLLYQSMIDYLQNDCGPGGL